MPVEKHVKSVVPPGEAPPSVKDFVFDLHDATRRACRLEDVQRLYESRYKELTDQFFGNTHWPDVNVIASEADNDELFLSLYK
jgi:hypothetical protein